MTGQRADRGGRRGSSRRAGLDAERFDEAWERVNERGRAAARWLTGMPSPIFAPDAGVQVHVVPSVVVHGRAALG